MYIKCNHIFYIFRMPCAFCYNDHEIDFRCAPRQRAFVERIFNVDLKQHNRPGYIRRVLNIKVKHRLYPCKKSIP